MQFGNLKSLADPVAPRAFIWQSHVRLRFVHCSLSSEPHGNKPAGEKLHIDFLLALAGFMVMVGEISGSINLSG